MKPINLASSPTIQPNDDAVLITDHNARFTVGELSKHIKGEEKKPNKASLSLNTQLLTVNGTYVTVSDLKALLAQE